MFNNRLYQTHPVCTTKYHKFQSRQSSRARNKRCIQRSRLFKTPPDKRIRVTMLQPIETLRRTIYLHSTSRSQGRQLSTSSFPKSSKRNPNQPSSINPWSQVEEANASVPSHTIPKNANSTQLSMQDFFLRRLGRQCSPHNAATPYKIRSARKRFYLREGATNRGDDVGNKEKSLHT